MWQRAETEIATKRDRCRGGEKERDSERQRHRDIDRARQICRHTDIVTYGQKEPV